MPIKELPNTAHKSGPLLSGAEEAARFSVAVDELLEKFKKDPNLAKQFLRDVGSSEMVKAEKATNGISAPKKRKQ